MTDSRTRSGTLLSLLLLGACGSVDGEAVGARASALARNAPDRSPFAREAPASVCPGANVVKGVDVSEFEAGYDFAAAKAAGNAFAIVRVSDGTGHPDASFDGFYPRVKAAGLVRGVYQYFEPSQDPIAQADLLLSKIGHKLESGDLPPILDLEAKGATGAQAKLWVDHVEAALGVKPILYAGYYFWVDDMGDPPGFGGYPLWIAGYVTCPSIPSSWSKWTFWQYSDGTVNGSGGVDLDLFNGTLSDLMALTAGKADYAAEVVSQTYPLASKGAVTVPLGQTVKGSITAKNVGAKPWKAGVTKLAPMPRDQACAMHASTWLSPTRVATIAADVPPGSEGTFAWDVEGNTVGDFDEYYGFVEENVTWFADAPLGGGPAENVLELKSHVVATDGGVSAVPTPPPTTPGPAPIATSADGGAIKPGPGGDGVAADPGDASATAGCATAVRAPSRGLLPWTMAALVFALGRRRTRRARRRS